MQKVKGNSLQKEMEMLIPQLAKAREEAENAATEPGQVQQVDAFHTERKRESGSLYKAGKSDERTGRCGAQIERSEEKQRVC